MPRRALAAIVLALTTVIVAVTPTVAQAADPPALRGYYKIFHRGSSFVPYLDSQYVPQGLAYWPERDALIISYYDSAGKNNSRLAVIDRKTGKKVGAYKLPEKGHVGGLAVSGRYVWLASTPGGTVSRLSKLTLATTPNGGQLKYSGTYKLATSSFATFSGDSLWVGRYDAHSQQYAYRYPLGLDEVPHNYAQKVKVPSGVQGMAIYGDKVAFTRSGGSGHDAYSTLDVRWLRNPVGTRVKAVTAPNMAEGLAVGAGDIHVVYETASAAYKDADYRVKTVHHGAASALY